MSYKITFEKENCAGCGICTTICDNWKLDDDGKAQPIKTELEEIGCNQDAADACPHQLITISKK